MGNSGGSDPRATSNRDSLPIPSIFTLALKELSTGSDLLQAAHMAASLWPEVPQEASDRVRNISLLRNKSSLQTTYDGYRSTVKSFLIWWLSLPSQERPTDPLSLSYAKDFLVWHFARGKRIGDSNNGTSSALRKLFLSYGREWFPDLEYAELLKGGIRDSLVRAPQRLSNSKDVFSALQASEIFKAAFEFKTVSREKGILFTFAFVTMLRASQLMHMKTEHWNIVVENNGIIHFEYQVSLKKQRKKFGNMVSRSVSNRHVSHAANAPSLYNPQLGDWAFMMKNFIEQQNC